MRIVLALLVVAACGKNTEPPPPSSGSPQAQPESGPSQKQNAGAPVAPTGGGGPAVAGVNEEAKLLFQNVCSTCHGPDGTGNGPAAASLNPKPRNYTDAAWQASVTDEDLKKTILLGGQAVGKSPMMPGNPQLKDKPEVLDGLVAIVRSFGKK